MSWHCGSRTKAPLADRHRSGFYRRPSMRRGSKAKADRPAVSQDAVLRSCEHSDRILRAVLGETATRSIVRFGPVLVLVLIVAAIASAVG